MALLSFKNGYEANIPFNSADELSFDTRRDVVTGEVTEYLVYCDGMEQEVDKATYEALVKLQR